jgi:hypothetical protein
MRPSSVGEPLPFRSQVQPSRRRAEVSCIGHCPNVDRKTRLRSGSHLDFVGDCN